MAKINPLEYLNENDKKFEVKKITEGNKTFVPVGARFGSWQSGTRFLEVGHVCIESDKGDTELGCTYYCRFALSQNSLWRIGRYAASLGYKEVFDPESMDDIQKVLMSGPVKITLVEGDYGLEAKYFNKAPCERSSDGFPSFSNEIAQLVIKAEQWVNKGFDKARQRESGSSSQTSTPQHKEKNSNDFSDEIPF